MFDMGLPYAPLPPARLSIFPPGGSISHRMLRPRELGASPSRLPRAWCCGSHLLYCFDAQKGTKHNPQSPDGHRIPGLPVSLIRPEHSVTSRLPAFPGVRGGRPATGRADNGLHYSDEGGCNLGLVVPGLQGRSHRLRVEGEREASGGPKTPSEPHLCGHRLQRPG